ncbi:MAG: NfeD family protein [Anaerolineae bacterium]|jgi:membrane protein implicated in regulation of membrane protease activity
MFESSLTTLNCVYLALFFVGLGYAIFIAITGGLSDIDMPNVDVDIPQIDLPGDVDIPGADIHIGGPDIAAGGIDAPDVSVSPLSPITLATFVTVFGGVGVITTQLFNVSPGLSLVISVVSGLISGGGMYLFYSQFLIRSQGSSEIRHGELIGLEAEVTVPIGENVTGQVTYLTKSGRMSSMARSTDGRPIPRGQLVEIVRTSGPQVLVRPVRVESEEEV